MDGWVCFAVWRDAKGAVNVARKGCGNEYQVRLMLRQCFERQCMQGCIYQIVRRSECHLQLIERRLARRQRFCIAHELEARVDGIADDVREIIEIQGGDVLGAILQPQRAKGPVEHVAFMLLIVGGVLERCKARTFRQVMPRRDAMGHAGVAALQKSNGRRDCRAVGLEVLGEEARSYRVLFAGQRAHSPMNGLHALRRQQLERQGEGQIGLFLPRTRASAGTP